MTPRASSPTSRRYWGKFDGVLNCTTRLSLPIRSKPVSPRLPAMYRVCDAWCVLHPGEPHAPTVGIHPVGFVDQPECFDYVFVTGGLASRLRAHGIDAATAASDHQPVWVELA